MKNPEIDPLHSPITLESVLKLKDLAIQRAFQLVTKYELSRSAEGIAALTYCLSTGELLRDHIFRIGTVDSSLMEKVDGGTLHNAARAIDIIGDRVGLDVITRTLAGHNGSLFIEERKKWLAWGKRNNQISPIDGNIDPIDGTGNIKLGLPFIASGIMFSQRDIGFLTGGVVDLTRSGLLFVESTGNNTFNTQLFDFDHRTYRLTRLHDKLDTPTPNELRIIALPRHINSLYRSELFGKAGFPHIPTFGGNGLLRLIQGEAEVMFDPGQIWYEAVLWGGIAQAAGLTVTTFRGESIDFNRIIQNSKQEPEYSLRIPIVISRNEEIHQQFLTALNQFAPQLVRY